MKTLLVLVYILTAGISPLWAQKANDFGAGITLGSPTGGTAKFWLDDSHAIDAGIGFDSHLTLYSDYLWHHWKSLPQPSKGKLPLYLGLGAQLRTTSPINEFGLRAVAGIAYWFPQNPVEIFLELVPVLRLSHGDGTDVNASIGLRYYF